VWPQRSRAWKARPVPSSWPDATPMAQVRPTCDGPLLTVRDRQLPVLRARRGHGRRGRSSLWPGSDGHKANRRVRRVHDDHLPRWQGPQARGSLGEELEPGPMLFRRLRSWRWMPCDLRFLCAGRDRWCPARTRGFRWRADPVRTRAPTITGWLRSLRCVDVCGARCSATGAGIGLPCPVGRFLAWEGLEGRPLVCLGGLGVQVEEGPAVLRAARASHRWRIASDADNPKRKFLSST
jgi:hypothetical protein